VRRPLPGVERRQSPEQELDERASVHVYADVGVGLRPCPAPEIGHGAAAGELRLALDRNMAVLGLDELRPEGVCDRDCVVDRRAAEPLGVSVEPVEEVI
jgi:hypothetical protein